MIELQCPYCEEDHEIPEDCEYGGEFTAPCGNVVEVAYDEQYDEENDDVWPLYFLWKSKKDRVTISSHDLSVYEKMLKLQASEFTRDGIMYSDEAVDRIQSQILAQAPPEFSKLDPPLELDVEAAARSREKTRALLDTLVTKMEVVHTPPDAPRLEGAWTCEIEKTAPAVVGLPDNGGEE